VNAATTSMLLPLRAANTLGECGGKALSLARLLALGYQVPQGSVVRDGAFQAHLHQAGLDAPCRALLSDLPAIEVAELRQRAAVVRAAICATPLAPALRQQLAQVYAREWQGKLLAVRSSAALEDGKLLSFAGQLDSVLGVDSLENLQDALRQVWASIWAERCLLYVRRAQVSNLRLGVVIQQQVNARHSGVLFTRDPASAVNTGRSVIEYVSGLGERLVSGAVTPNRARVRHSDFAVFQDELSDAEAILPHTRLAELARIGQQLERQLGAPQDIEWSVDENNGVVLLQSRPITASGDDTKHSVWSNANIAENFPDVVSPFLYSIVAPGYSAYFRNLALGFGISRRRIDAMRDALENIVGLHAGRLYYNLSSIHATIYLAPGGASLAAWFNLFTGADEFPGVKPVAFGPLGRLLELAGVSLKTAWQYLWIQKRVARFEGAVDDCAMLAHPTRLAHKTLPQLAEDLRRFLDIRLRRWNDAALADTATLVCYGLLKRMLAADTAAASDPAMHGSLLSGLPGLASARPISELWKLSREVRSNPSLQQMFLDLAPADLLSRLAAPEHEVFRARFERYLDIWGFRYSGELMLTNPTPREDPLPVIRLLQNYCREAGPGPDEVSARQTLAREQATMATAARLASRGWARWLPLSRSKRFLLVLRATQGAIRLRERARMKQALLYTRLRNIMLRIGEKLCAQGVLAQPDEVFFLTAAEVLALAAAPLPASVLTETIHARMLEQERCRQLRPPDSFALARGEQWQGQTDAVGETQDSGKALRGSGACGGKVQGHAAVVLDIREADRIKAGDILVTCQTDPGWAAVFFLIKGLVIERGGMLSHGAIIAREYGIPAVVGVPGATQRIRDGDELKVNGDSGVIELCHH
jgi:phosphohistidine swiveling domain-containing protein